MYFKGGGDRTDDFDLIHIVKIMILSNFASTTRWRPLIAFKVFTLKVYWCRYISIIIGNLCSKAFH